MAFRKSFLLLLATVCLNPLVAPGQTPANLVTQNVPPIPVELRAAVSPYLEFRTAAFQRWHPSRREMLITTRFADTPQLHAVKSPGGARRQLTFLPEPVASASYQPKEGRYIVFSQDTGGGEFFQLYRLDPGDGRITLLTDGKSRNTGAVWSRSGHWLAYGSTRRNGKDNDIYVVDPARPDSTRLVSQLDGGGWQMMDWSEDEQRLLVLEYISINESRPYLVDVRTGAKSRVPGTEGIKAAYGQGRFARDGKAVWLTTDHDSEFLRLVRFDLATGGSRVLTEKVTGDVEALELSPEGDRAAYVTNERGASVLRLVNLRTGKELAKPSVPLGVITGLSWRQDGSELGFSLTSARSPADAYSYNTKKGKVERWTESETGGLAAENFVEPQLATMKSFDGLEISAFVYRPDPARFPGRRPVIVSIHGGPESQFRPVFMARNNYYLNVLGVAVIAPNVRGSAGFGKTYLTLDNGFKREDSVRDIGAVLDWVKQDGALDADKVAVMGGSYGGYMVLASMIHFNDRLRAGVDVVGISNFLTFLANTQDYRRDLRRAEYGDERDEKMREFLGRISPANNVERMKKPLLVVQGFNDPRVPVTESEQMVRAVEKGGGKVWYLMAKDEGHGFGKKKNADFQFLTTILFLQEHLLR